MPQRTLPINYHYKEQLSLINCYYKIILLHYCTQQHNTHDHSISFRQSTEDHIFKHSDNGSHVQSHNQCLTQDSTSSDLQQRLNCSNTKEKAITRIKSYTDAIINNINFCRFHKLLVICSCSHLPQCPSVFVVSLEPSSQTLLPSPAPFYASSFHALSSLPQTELKDP